MSSGSFQNDINKMCLELIYLIYMYEKDLALNNLQNLICHKTKPNHLNELIRVSTSVVIHLTWLSVAQNQIYLASRENRNHDQ